MSKKPYKVRAKNYNKKLSKEGGYEEVIKVSVTPEKKEAKPKKAAKKKWAGKKNKTPIKFAEPTQSPTSRLDSEYSFM